MKKIILVVIMMCCLMVCGCGNYGVQSETLIKAKSSVKPIGVEDMAEEVTMAVVPVKSVDSHTKCGEGKCWLVGNKTTTETTEPTTEAEQTTERYDWQTYEKPIKDSYGFNKGECDTPYAYNEEYFYNESFDHWNVDKVYDEDIANSYPPYNEEKNN